MKTKAFLLSLVAVLITPLALHAQATRTWVSGVGDDANPCSRTAPGKTFAGAISKTAAGGEISVLDPGGFGAVTITKSITISGDGTLAGILAAATNGVIINAGDADVIVLRNISIEGVGTGLNGIRIIKAGAVHIENCTINGFQTGISFESSSPNAQLFVNGCRVHKCTTGGIALSGSGAGAVSKIEGTTVEGCAAGVTLTTGVATLNKCTAAGNAAPGFSAGAGTSMTLNGCVSSGNAVGVNADGTVFLSDSMVTNNAGAGLQKTGTIFSYRNNRIGGNSPDGRASRTTPLR